MLACNQVLPIPTLPPSVYDLTSADTPRQADRDEATDATVSDAAQETMQTLKRQVCVFGLFLFVGPAFLCLFITFMVDMMYEGLE